MSISIPIPSRLRGEQGAAYEAFMEYLNQGAARSIRRLCAEYRERAAAGVPVPTRRLSTIQDWSIKHRWQERIAAYERERNAAIQAELESRRLQARLDTADLGQALRAKAADALSKFEAIEEVSITEPGRGKNKGKKVVIGKRFVLSAATLTALAKAGVEIERLALGEATQRVEGVGLEQRLADDLGRMTAEQRAALYAALLREEEDEQQGSDPAGPGDAAAGE